jgi:hypothetical protein
VARSRAWRSLSPARLLSLYGTTGGLFLSGVLWLVLRLSRGEDSFAGPWEALSQKIHGGCAMVFLFVFGWILDVHVLANWGARRNRLTGGLVTGSLALLALTGYGLYYFGGEGLRRATEWSHWVLGLLAAPLLLWHVLAGRSKAPPS